MLLNILIKLSFKIINDLKKHNAISKDLNETLNYILIREK